ncbi:ATP-dependent helicase [Brevibacterium sp. SMBL_HHYL_HB1]|uniref:ATP-dependent helicase n=1 Tax=Brevibacterium sp. SMBL_HHYL_HB1 TaxID=2777556 RepID=UPI001BA55F22|nr:ATP-dependent helicase [Brevibacterium sp. SMBL_HHYL_HB1]QUL78047.1 ATP-dependent helicase [Brevibacterium sp. SMBL_HHYL_HB1]
MAISKRTTHALPSALTEAIRELDAEQRSVLTAEGNLVITAGPGSGKTRTVVARAGCLLSTQIQPPRGLASITYTNQAASELREGLAQLGVTTRRLFAGTMHSFCLTQVLPYATLVGTYLPSLDRLMTTSQIKDLEQECADAVGINVWDLREGFPGLRRRVAASEDVSNEPEAYVHAVEHYEALCERRNVWDFEAIVLRSVRLLEDHPEIAEVIQAKFPIVMIDEYQDLGAGLHRLVELLLASGVEITAVGDADQSIFGFSGGDPVYLEELCRRDDFAMRRLVTNYRCGSAVVAAAELTLDRARGYSADPGVLEFRVAEGSSAEQAREVVSSVRQFLDAGLAAEEIAVLVRNRKPLAPLIERGLRFEGIPVQHGGLLAGPVTDVGRWLEAAALYAVRMSGQSDADLPPEVGVSQLLDRLESMRRIVGRPKPSQPRLARVAQLHASLLDGNPTLDLTMRSWLRQVVESLNLRDLAREVGDPRSVDELNGLLEAPEDVALASLASDSVGTGRVVMSTFHGAKGRTFSAVVIPGLSEGVVPPWSGPPWKRRPKTGRALEEERRGFYVALTRSRGSVLLQVSSTGVDHQGYEIQRGYSSFAQQLADRLGKNL